MDLPARGGASEVEDQIAVEAGNDVVILAAVRSEERVRIGNESTFRMATWLTPSPTAVSTNHVQCARGEWERSMLDSAR